MCSRIVAALAHASLTFMLLWVPEPVWNTTSGKWSINLPDMTFHDIKSSHRILRRHEPTSDAAS